MLSQNSGKNGVANAAVNVAALTPHPRNYNQHSAGQVGDLRRSLRRFGQVRSIVVQAQADPGRWLIVAGHGIVQAARAEGIESLRADIIPADWDDAMVLAYLAADNELARQGQPDEAQLAALLRDVQATADRELAALAAGSEARLTEMLATLDGGAAGDAEPQVDRAAELNEKWQVAPGDLWRIGEHRLACGDCTDKAVVERVMGGEKAEMVWTDPPYGVAIGDKNKYLNSIAPSNRVEDNLVNDTIDESGITALLSTAFDNAVSCCTAGAAWYVAAPPGPLHLLFGAVLKERGIWRQTIQWVKNNSTFSPMGVCYHWQAEPIFFGWIPNGGHRWYGGRQQTTVWNIDRPLMSPEHPTMKPVELVGRAVKNSSQSDELVFDPFLGSGTTLVACQNLRRRGRGIEISPEYCAVVLERMATAFPGIEIERLTPRAGMDLDDEAGRK